MALNWAQNFVVNLHEAVVASGRDPDHGYKAAHANRGTLPRKRKVNWTPDLSARPGRLQRRAFR